VAMFLPDAGGKLFIEFVRKVRRHKAVLRFAAATERANLLTKKEWIRKSSFCRNRAMMVEGQRRHMHCVSGFRIDSKRNDKREMANWVKGKQIGEKIIFFMSEYNLLFQNGRIYLRARLHKHAGKLVGSFFHGGKCNRCTMKAT
jgi:hypothetical protein